MTYIKDHVHLLRVLWLFDSPGRQFDDTRAYEWRAKKFRKPEGGVFDVSGLNSGWSICDVYIYGTVSVLCSLANQAMRMIRNSESLPRTSSSTEPA